jgi:hypothetical protein
MVRIEEGIKHQNTNLEKMMIQMDQKFENMDKRFSENREDMDNRFTGISADMNKRFEVMDKRFNRQGQFLIVIFASIVTTAITVILQTS